MKKFLRFWGPPILWMMVIFVFSSKQKVAITDSYTVSFLFFKTLHLIEYATLYVLFYRAVRNTLQISVLTFVVAFILTCIFAGSDELHQLYVPTREGKLRDVIIDGLGGGIAWIGIAWWLPKMPKKLKCLARNWQLI